MGDSCALPESPTSTAARTVLQGPGMAMSSGVPGLGRIPRELFWKYAGDSHVIDARDLRNLISDLAQKGVDQYQVIVNILETGAESKYFHETASFSIEACRSLIAMSDRYQTGVLDYDEMNRLWEEVTFWRKIFSKYDRERSGSIETCQLQHVLAELGISLHLDTISALATRYGGKDRTLFFEDFVLCLAKTMSLFTAFKEYSQSSPGEARISMDQWFLTTKFL